MTDTTATTTETPVTEETPATEPKVESAEQTETANETNDENEKGDESTESVESDDSHPKLFVGRLPVGTKDTQLKELFGTYGEVTHCDIVGKYGFVHMKNKEEADKAMAALNNHSLKGSNITVQLSTSTAKKTKKKTLRNNNNNINKNNDKNNKRPNLKNGFTPNKQNKLSNGNNNNNRNKNGNGNINNNRQNGNMNNLNNKMRGGRGKFNRPMNRPMMHPQLTPMQGPGFYNGPPMNSYYQPPIPAHPMTPPGPPRDMYYNNRPSNNGQYYGQNGPPPQSMYNGAGAPPMHQPSPSQNYYQPQYNRGQAPVNKMGPMIQSPPQQQQTYGGYGNNYSTAPQPQMSYTQNYSGGYGNGQIMGNGTNKYGYY